MSPPPAPSATVVAPHGVVCSVDHLASAAGVAVLRSGGGAVDAAIATSAVLAVTTPQMCGMGGDLFALVHHRTGSPVGLNASGRAGSGADPGRLRAEGHRRMPFRGDIRAAPVPGCVDGWVALHDRFGRLPMADVLAAAVGYAESGFPASPLLAAAVPQLEGVLGAEDLVRPGGLRPGALVRRPGVGRALRAIGARGREGFYSGDFGAGLVALGAGEFVAADLGRVQADWVEPLGWRGPDHDIWTVPPNSQGYLTLLGAAIAAGLDLGAPGSDRRAHLLIESARAAGRDRPSVLHERADGASLLDPDRVDRLRASIDPERRHPRAAPAGAGGTIHLTVVDAERCGVSLIQSNASGFGCHVFEPTTGIGLHNRGLGFSLEPGHPAEYRPGRRPPSTLSPALVTSSDGHLRGVLGTMGGDSQPQVLLQLLTSWLVDGRSPGAAIREPRWVVESGSAEGFDTWDDVEGQIVRLEAHAAPEVAPGLERRGHRVVVAPWSSGNWGHAHLIEVGDEVLRGASDPRALIGAALGW